MKRLIFLFFFILVSTLSFGQFTSCQSEVLLNTGYNHNSSSVYALGNADPYWRVVQMPNFSSCTNINVPSPSYTVSSSSWAAAYQNSQWISYRNVAALSCNNECGSALPIVFEKQFCLVKSDTVFIDAGLRFDNSACVLIDNTYIPLVNQNINGSPVTFSSSQTTISPCRTCDNWDDTKTFISNYETKINKFKIYLTAGTHYIRVAVRNNSGADFGLNFIGTVKSASGVQNNFLCPDNCQKNGTIAIFKVLDKNCDKKIDSNETGANWSFMVTGPNGFSKTVTTDNTGWAFVNDLSNYGDYLIKEIPQSGWTPVSPLNGTTTIKVDNNQPKSIYFYNCPAQCCDEVKLKTTEACKSGITSSCKVKSIKVDLNNGILKDVSWNCGTSPSGYWDLSTYTFTPSIACALDMNMTIEPTLTSDITINYTLTFDDNSTCKKTEVKKGCISNWCSKPNTNFCPNNLISNGNFEKITGNPSIKIDQDIVLASDWVEMWKGISTADLWCPNTGIQLGPNPSSGVYAGFWIENRTAVSTDNSFREGMYNKFANPIAKNSGNYSLKFNIADSKKVSSTNPITIGVYGVYNPNNIYADEPSGFANPKNIKLWENKDPNVKVVLLGKITPPLTLDNNWSPQQVSFNTNSTDFPTNGITHIMITAYDDVLSTSYAKLYINFDDFCLQKDITPPSTNCCPKLDIKFGMCEPNNAFKHAEIIIDNAGNSSPITNITMSATNNPTFITGTLKINNVISNISWTPYAININSAANASQVSFSIAASATYTGTLTFTVIRADNTKCTYTKVWKDKLQTPVPIQLSKETIPIPQGYRLSGHQVIIKNFQNIKFVRGYIVVGFSDRDSIVKDKPEFFAVSGAYNPLDSNNSRTLLPFDHVVMSDHNAIYHLDRELIDSDLLKHFNFVIKSKIGTRPKLRLTILDQDGQILGTNELTISALGKDEVTSTSVVVDGSTDEKVVELFSPYPNPAQNEVTIKYLIGSENSIRLELFSLDGKLIKVLDKGNKIAGLHEVKVDINQLGAANYVVKLITNNAAQSQMLSVVK